MRTRRFFLLAVLCAVLALAVQAEKFPDRSEASGKGVSTPTPRPNIHKRIFSNEDLEAPSSQAPVPAAPEAVEAAAPTAEVPVTTRPADVMAKYVRERDPNWYREQLAPLRAEMEGIDGEIRQLREFRATGRGMTGGLAMDRPGLRLTPENEIEQLGLRRRELARQIGELEDSARRNDIAPGALLADSPYATPVAPRTRQALTAQEIQELEKRREHVEAQLAEEKEHLRTTEEQLQLAERDDVLHRQQFYSNPDYASDDKGKAQLAALASEVAARRAEVSAAQASVEALQEELRTLERALGPEPARRLTPEEQREAWQQRLRPLRDELARVESELERMRAQTAAQGLTLYLETSTGSPTSTLLRRLGTRAAELRQQIASLEDEAQRAGVPPGWVR
jgi:hypothetical protein